MIRSVLAVISGYLSFYLAMLVLWLAFGHQPRDTIPSTAFLTASVFCEALFALGSGYLIAFIARRRELLHAAFLSAVFVIFGILYILLGLNHYPLWIPLAMVFLHAPAVLLGAYLRKRGVRRQ
jgi:peptidoglycan/LPS O-acetylase OafA/YrhL